ncbi:hypothetical protein CEXT_76511 [Caerostris extrusa]|uniref:Uncharacterized protein n=1 Tax=Caerostris extrusa TaxID=172846 RepID=A0AAV4WVQ3_CAEEX|nr:hypothetical protein CEXT_76511 [Caerostris extrusa]
METNGVSRVAAAEDGRHQSARPKGNYPSKKWQIEVGAICIAVTVWKGSMQAKVQNNAACATVGDKVISDRVLQIFCGSILHCGV